MLYLLSAPYNRAGVAAAGGVLDLTGADFSDALYNMDGDWEFYYNRLLAPDDFASSPSPPPSYIYVPMSWEKAGYPLKGFATYRLTVLTGEPEVSVRIPKITFSSAVWINGRLVFAAGKPGLTPEQTTPAIRTGFVNVRPENGRLEIIAQAASYNWYVAGLRNGWELSRPAAMITDAATRYALLAMAIGALLVLALYHFILYLYRRNEWVYISFALTALSSALRYALETNGFAQMLLPGGMGEGLTRLYLATVFLQPGLMIVFIHAAFAMPLKGTARRVVYGLCLAVPSAFTFIIPGGMIYADYYLFLVIIPMAWSALSAARVLRKKPNGYNGLFLISLVAFLLWYPIQKIWLDDQLFMPGIASHLFLLLSQCVMLAVSYAETKRREADLAAKTAFYHKMSHDLLTPLTVVSTSIQVVKVAPEDAELLKKSQAEIMKMAEMIHDALRDGDEQ
jgi:signal transduction histidine kinase